MDDGEFIKYLGGFFDGDGSIYISCNTLTMTFSQSQKNILDVINNYYNNIFNFYTCNNTTDIRTQFSLKLTGKKLYPVLKDLEETCIIKNPQIKIALEFLQYINKKGTVDKKTKLQEVMKDMNKNKIDYVKDKPYDKVNLHYISGLFDSDGHVGIYKSGAKAHITQVSDINILNIISQFYEGSCVNDGKLYFGKKDVLINFLENIKDIVIYKKSQVDKTLQWLYSDNPQAKDLIMYQVKKLKTCDLNIEDYKNYIEVMFDDVNKNYTSNDLMMYKKYKELENTSNNNSYNNKIYDNFENIYKIKPELIFCESKSDNKLWLYYRNKTSSIAFSGSIGRNVRILVKDVYTGKYIGVMALGSDFYDLSSRSNYIKKYTDIPLEKYLQNIANLNCCVPLQPFGFNSNGGKLLASLASSREVFDYWSKKYNEPLLAISTLGINGKSIIYDRLRNLKFIGFTKGNSAVHIPEEVIGLCKIVYNHLGLQTNRCGTMDIVRQLLYELKLPQQFLSHENKKGLYFGWLFSTKFDSNYDKSQLSSVDEISSTWLNRWCIKRYDRLNAENKLKRVDLYDTNSPIFKEIKHYKFPGIAIEMKIKSPRVMEKYVDDTKKIPLLVQKLDGKTDVYKKILKFKNVLSTQESVDEIKKEYSILLKRDDISKLWQGLLSDLPEEISSLDEYKSMMLLKKKRTYNKEKSTVWRESIAKNREKRRNFTEEQLMNILSDKYTEKTSVTCGEKYIGKNGEILKRQVIEAIWSGKTKPLDETKIDEEYNNIIKHRRSRKCK
jgi:hypothetical protein